MPGFKKNLKKVRQKKNVDVEQLVVERVCLIFIKSLQTREKQSVKVEFMLLCFGYKLNKLHKSIQTQSLGVTLYKNSIA